MNSNDQEDTDAYLVEKAKELAHEAKENGVELRLIGSIGVRLSCDESIHRDDLEREIGDIDYVSLKVHSEDIISIFEDAGYKWNKDVLMSSAGKRLVFYGEDHEIDIFLDGIYMCHNIDLRNRIQIGKRLALNPSDLLLEKLQIRNVNEKDLKDISILLSEFPITSSDEGINISYICDIFSNNWGFYHTASTNLTKTKRFVQELPFDEQNTSTIVSKIDELLRVIESCDKSIKWKIRGAIGTRIRWYNQVDVKHR